MMDIQYRSRVVSKVRDIVGLYLLGQSDGVDGGTFDSGRNGITLNPRLMHARARSLNPMGLEVICVPDSLNGSWADSLNTGHATHHLHSVFGGSWVYGYDCDPIPELRKGSRRHPGTLLPSLGIRFSTLLDKSNPLMQDLPNHAAESMCAMAQMAD